MKQMQNYLIKYMEAHIISLNQDIYELAQKMEGFDEDSEDFIELDFQYNFLSGQVHGVSHILEVARERENI
jgi:hypothetical protein